MRHVVAWLVAWFSLFWLWLLLAGDWNRIEWIAAASAAAVAATVGEIARTRAGVRPRVPLRWVAKGWTVPGMIVADFGILMWALATSAMTREVVRGSFRSRTIDAAGQSPTAVGARTWPALLSMYSPNAYVIDIDPETGRALFHDLVPYRKSEEPL